jgi:LPS sulfotransferase NodH
MHLFGAIGRFATRTLLFPPPVRVKLLNNTLRARQPGQVVQSVCPRAMLLAIPGLLSSSHPFVIIASPRTASSSLCTSLENALSTSGRAILCGQELLHPKSLGSYSYGTSMHQACSHVTSEELRNCWRGKSKTALQTFWEHCPANTLCGIKIFPAHLVERPYAVESREKMEQAARDMVDFMRSRHVRVVRLERRNITSQYRSLEKAYATGEWGFSATGFVSYQFARRTPEAQFKEALDVWHTAFGESTGLHVKHVFFEDLVSAQGLNPTVVQSVVNFLVGKKPKGAASKGSNSPPSARPFDEIGRFHSCEPVPQRGADLLQWVIRRHTGTMEITYPGRELTSGNFDSVLPTMAGLYIYDRCWTPRTICSLRLRADVRTSEVELLVPREKPPTSLVAGKYVVLFGPAAAVGTNSLVSTATLLEEKLGMPVVNLGRGGAGPHTFLGPSWSLISTLVAHAEAVVVMLMSRLPKDSLPLYERLRSEGNLSAASELRDESVAGALQDTTKLLLDVQRAAKEAGQRTPALVALWFSRCPLARAGGCTYDKKASIASRRAILEFPHWLDSSFVRSLQQQSGAEIVLADYGHLPSPAPLLTNLCEPACAWPGRDATGSRKNCSSDDARASLHRGGIREGNAPSRVSVPLTMALDRKVDWRAVPNLLCPDQCASVASNSQTYPTAFAHELAAHKLSLAIRERTSGRRR